MTGTTSRTRSDLELQGDLDVSRTSTVNANYTDKQAFPVGCPGTKSS